MHIINKSNKKRTAVLYLSSSRKKSGERQLFFFVFTGTGINKEKRAYIFLKCG